MAELILSREAEELPFVKADVGLLGVAVRQLMTAHPDLTLVQATSLVGAGLNIVQYLLDVNAENASLDITDSAGDDWNIEVLRVEGRQQ